MIDEGHLRTAGWSPPSGVTGIPAGVEASRHVLHNVVPVWTGGEIVAWLCVPCDEQLSRDWGPLSRESDDPDYSAD